MLQLDRLQSLIVEFVMMQLAKVQVVRVEVVMVSLWSVPLTKAARRMARLGPVRVVSEISLSISGSGVDILVGDCRWKGIAREDVAVEAKVDVYNEWGSAGRPSWELKIKRQVNRRSKQSSRAREDGSNELELGYRNQIYRITFD